MGAIVAGVESAVGTSDATDGVTVNVPAGAAAGGLLVAFVSSSVNGSENATFSPVESGWTVDETATYTAGAGADGRLRVYSRPATNSEPSTYKWTGFEDTDDYLGVILVLVTDHSGIATTSTVTYTGGTSFAANNFNTSDDDVLVLAALGTGDAGSRTISQPSGWTGVDNVDDDPGTWGGTAVARKAFATAGTSTSPCTFTTSAAVDNSGVILIEILPFKWEALVPGGGASSAEGTKDTSQDVLTAAGGLTTIEVTKTASGALDAPTGGLSASDGVKGLGATGSAVGGGLVAVRGMPVVSTFLLAPDSLGCGEWQVLVGGRFDGPVLAELDIQTLTMERLLNDASSASVNVNARNCGDLLRDLEPWEHEVRLFRDGIRVWTGPIIGFQSGGRDTFTVTARDRFAWWEKRLLVTERTFVEQDLGLIFRTIASLDDPRDPVPITVVVPDVGVNATRVIERDADRRIADELRDLSGPNLDFVMVDDQLLGGAMTVTRPPVYLTDNDVDKVSWSEDGAVRASEVVAKGSTAGADIGGPRTSVSFREVVGGVGTAGLLQVVQNYPDLFDRGSVEANAAAVLADRQRAPLKVKVTLSSQADHRFRDLIPGGLYDVRLTDSTVKPVAGILALTGMTVDVDAEGAEAVALDLQGLPA